MTSNADTSQTLFLCFFFFLDTLSVKFQVYGLTCRSSLAVTGEKSLQWSGRATSSESFPVVMLNLPILNELTS